MAEFPNGQIPLSRLLPLGSGTNRDGYWEWRVAPGTKRRWEALVADVRRNEGVTLKITDGWNAYRPLDAQWTAYRNSAPGMAAYPGTSSHGGVYNGRDAMAIDVSNWGQIGQAKFYSYARKHGFTAGAISNEPWHIIDYNPWAVPAGAEQENDMGTLDNTEANYQIFATFLQRALKYDTRENGHGPNWKLGPTIWEKIGQATSAGQAAEAAAKANKPVPMTDAQIKTITDAVTAVVAKLPVSVDNAAIAKAVRETFKTDPLK